MDIISKIAVVINWRIRYTLLNCPEQAACAAAGYKRFCPVEIAWYSLNYFLTLALYYEIKGCK
jgi:hypothetical protein